MTRKLILGFLFLIFFFNASAQLLGTVKTIHVIPETAKVFYNGQEVGNGSYSIKFGKNDEFVMLKFEAPGFITKQVKLFKNNPKKTISYELSVDEAAQNSVGEGEGVDLANKWFDVTCKAGMTEDIIWKRLMNVAINNFDNVEVRDKQAGWIKTAWSTKSFINQIVRTRLEIKLALGEEELKYRVRISSEIAEYDCGKNDECFKKYARVLKKYEQVINELQSSIGSNF